MGRRQRRVLGVSVTAVSIIVLSCYQQSKYLSWISQSFVVKDISFLNPTPAGVDEEGSNVPLQPASLNGNHSALREKAAKPGNQPNASKEHGNLRQEIPPAPLLSSAPTTNETASATATNSSTASVCEPPFVFLPDLPPKWNNNSNSSVVVPPRRIPRGIHLSMKSRCMHPGHYETAVEWHNAFPYDTVFFHDDEDVDRFVLEDNDWPEFPLIKKIYRHCLVIGGAIKVDIWRILIIYKLGGLYADMDVRPGKLLHEGSAPHPEDQAFALSDSRSRSSQWLFAMEPGHPILSQTIQSITKNMMALKQIGSLKPVFHTGPGAMWAGLQVVMLSNSSISSNALKAGGVFYSNGVQLRKIPPRKEGYVISTFRLPRKCHNGTKPCNLKQLILEETPSQVHWTIDLRQEQWGAERPSCAAAIKASRGSVE